MDGKVLRLVLLLVTTSVCCAEPSPSDTSSSMYGGTVATDDNSDTRKYPYMVAIEYINLKYPFCGGSLIRLDVVLTAAHCVKCKDKTSVQVRAGTYKLGEQQNINSTDQVRNIKTVIIHERHNLTGEEEYDFALLGLERSFNEDKFVKTINVVPRRLHNTFLYQRGRALGWGRMENGTKPTDLLYVDFKIHPKERCSSLMGGSSNNEEFTKLCLRAARGKGACSGDSGGPFVVQYYDNDGTPKEGVLGVTSYVSGNRDLKVCYPKKGSIYADASFVQDWIEEWLRRDAF